ncbi:uncharacterized protein LOC126800685 [Argentina anserina]|uniref:uncharacterized protein LOC126800685 n=1 Tax=Argentina anserina TaxID=57926 RepID=UPI0021762F06|nr:uncharacterized protein LOC126800685 [Potentilla anserina]
MPHPQDHGFCSNGAVRLALVLIGVCLVGYTVRQSLHWRFKESSSCPPCLCDCSEESALISIDCGKHEPEMKREMEKDIIALISEELNLQEAVANETLHQSEELLMSARKISLHYQKEAEKCTAGVETCEEAREGAQAQLTEELKATEVWERRAWELGWKEMTI